MLTQDVVHGELAGCVGVGSYSAAAAGQARPPRPAALVVTEDELLRSVVVHGAIVALRGR